MKESAVLSSMLEFHHTPKHASWLNIAESQINVMDTEYPNRRFESYYYLKRQVKAWTEKPNWEKKGIE